MSFYLLGCLISAILMFYCAVVLDKTSKEEIIEEYLPYVVLVVVISWLGVIYAVWYMNHNKKRQ